MQITVDGRDGGRSVVHLQGRLDLVSATSLRAAVADSVAEGRAKVVIDLGEVPFVDSSGLGALIGALKEARKAGGELRIAGATESVLSVLRLMRLDRVLRPYEDVDSALEGL